MQPTATEITGSAETEQHLLDIERLPDTERFLDMERIQLGRGWSLLGLMYGRRAVNVPSRRECERISNPTLEIGHTDANNYCDVLPAPCRPMAARPQVLVKKQAIGWLRMAMPHLWGPQGDSSSPPMAAAANVRTQCSFPQISPSFPLW